MRVEAMQECREREDRLAEQVRCRVVLQRAVRYPVRREDDGDTAIAAARGEVLRRAPCCTGSHSAARAPATRGWCRAGQRRRTTTAGARGARHPRDWGVGYAAVGAEAERGRRETRRAWRYGTRAAWRGFLASKHGGRHRRRPIRDANPAVRVPPLADIREGDLTRLAPKHLWQDRYPHHGFFIWVWMSRILPAGQRLNLGILKVSPTPYAASGGRFG